MKRVLWSAHLFVISSAWGKEQCSLVSQYPIHISGYFKYETYIDSRKIVGSSEGYNLFYPLPRISDTQGNDINGRPEYAMVVLASRMKAVIESPFSNQWTAKGVAEIDINGRKDILHLVRIRHAYIFLEHQAYALIAGHTWHPFYVPPHTPQPVANNSGQPFETYGRYPQLRFSFTHHDNTFLWGLLSQVDFTSDGPEQERTHYLKNSILPELHFQWQRRIGKHWIAAGIDFKRIVPRFITQKNLYHVEKVESIMASLMIDCACTKHMRLKSRLLYAENGSDMSLIGGYGVHSIHPDTDYRTYTPIRCFSWWTELSYKYNTQWEPSLFVAYARNLGARSTLILDTRNEQGIVIDQHIFGFATNVQQLARISPRIRYKRDALEIAGEIEYTHAWHGAVQSSGNIVQTTNNGVVRCMVGIYYHF